MPGEGIGGPVASAVRLAIIRHLEVSELLEIDAGGMGRVFRKSQSEKIEISIIHYFVGIAFRACSPQFVIFDALFEQQ